MVRAYLREYKQSDRHLLLKRLVGALAVAAGEGFIETVSALIDEKVPAVTLSPNNPDTNPLHDHALHTAALNGRAEIVELLLKKTAAGLYVNRVEAKSGRLSTAFYEAVWRRDFKTASLLATFGANPNLFPGREDPPICVAADTGDREMVAMLCEVEGIQVNARRVKDGATALCIASLRGDLEVVSLLLKNGADVAARTTSSGSPPLLLAAISGHVDVIEILIQNGAEINNSVNVSGATPVFMAAQIGHPQAVRYLVANGADVSIGRRTDNATPLHIAAQKGFLEIVSLLCEEGRARPSTGKGNPLSIAIHQGHLDVARYLIGRGMEALPSDLLVAGMRGHEEIVSYLAGEVGIPVDYLPPNQKSLLYYLLKKRAGEGSIRIVIEKGATLDIRTTVTSKTPIYLAAKKRKLNVLRLLLEFAEKAYGMKLDVDVADHKGRTALWYAAKFGQTDMVSLLLREGAKISTSDRKGRSCIDIASQHGKSKIAAMLVDSAFAATNLYS